MVKEVKEDSQKGMGIPVGVDSIKNVELITYVELTHTVCFGVENSIKIVFEYLIVRSISKNLIEKSCIEKMLKHSI